MGYGLLGLLLLILIIAGLFQSATLGGVGGILLLILLVALLTGNL